MSLILKTGFSRTENEFSNRTLPVKGKLPNWLKGSFIRNGPGTFKVQNEHYKHWFDGLAMLHKFYFEDGKAFYSNRYLQSKAYRSAMEQHRITHSEFAVDPTRNFLQKITAVFNQKITDSAKVNIDYVMGKYLALGETPTQYEIDPKDLSTVAPFFYEQKYKQHVTTAHPVVDRQRDLTYQLVTRFGRVSHYRFLEFSADGGRRLVNEIPVYKPAYLHSFGLSPEYIILAEFPLKVVPLKLLFQIKPFIENYRWYPQKGTTYYIIDRNSGAIIQKVQSEASFAFHHVNAFMVGDELIMDLVEYETADVLQSFYLHHIGNSELEIPAGKLVRQRLNIKTGRIHQEILSDEVMEMPRFSDRHKMFEKDYRYVYALSVNKEKRKGFYNQIIKIDLHKNKNRYWSETGCHPTEPTFIARPQGQAEDDGVIITIVLDVQKKSSFALILDAASFTELARIEVPQNILIGYHGNFFAG